MKKFFSLVAAALVAVAANAQNYDMVDLTADDFKTWSSADATATPTEEPAYGAYVLNEPTGLPYGHGSVVPNLFANLDEYDVLVITATEGTPRILINRETADGPIGYEYPANDAYVTVAENEDGSKTYTMDVVAVKAALGYVHLLCIKGANWANTTVTSIQVGKKIEETTGVNAISAAAAQGQCYNILGQRVNNVKAGQIYIINGKKYINR